MDMVGGYAQNEIAGMNEAELEIRALIKAASALNKIKEDWENSQKDLSQALQIAENLLGKEGSITVIPEGISTIIG